MLPLPERPGVDVPKPETAGSERRHQPELGRAKPVEKKTPIANEFEPGGDGDEMEDEAVRNSRMTQVMQGVARQVALDPTDGMDL